MLQSTSLTLLHRINLLLLLLHEFGEMVLFLFQSLRDRQAIADVLETRAWRGQYAALAFSV